MMCWNCPHPQDLHSDDRATDFACRVTGCVCKGFRLAPAPPAEPDRILKVELPEGYAGKVSIEFWPPGTLKPEENDGEAG